MSERKSRLEAFRQAAREFGRGEDEERFEERPGQLVKPKTVEKPK